MGIILGPVYILLLGSLSGEPLLEQQLLGANGYAYGNQSFARSAVTSSQKKLDIYLSPEMNPIRFSFPARYINKQRLKREQYSRFLAELKLSGQLVWQKTLSIREKPIKREQQNSSVKINNNRVGAGGNTFAVERAGNYQLTITPTSMQQVNVSDLSVSIRRNVKRPNIVIWFPGVLMVLVGIAGYYYEKRKEYKS